MMTSNLLSRLLPSNPAGRSIYDDLRAHDEASESDLEEQAGLAIDEENLGFHDDDLANADAFNGEDSRITAGSTAFLAGKQQNHSQGPRIGSRGKQQGRRSKWIAQSPRLLEEDADDDVPASLLIEGDDLAGPSTPAQPRIRQGAAKRREPAIPGPSNRETRAHWEAAQAQQKLHHDDDNPPVGPQPVRQNLGAFAGGPREKAMWRWINITNLDNFMKEVYEYYTGAGLWCITLDRALTLAYVHNRPLSTDCSWLNAFSQTIFVAIFVTFLTQCVNFKEIPQSRKLSEVLVSQCTANISGMPNVAIWLFTLHVFWRVYELLIDIPRLMRVRDFYLYLLEVPDTDMQTISWQDIVGRIMALRDANPVTVEKISPSNRKYLGSQSKQRLDAHDIANRLMRKENYLIALFNKEILDLTLPLPFLQGRQLFSRTLLWNLDWCIMDLVFNETGQVRQLILKDSHRRQLSDGLRGRFLFAGFMNALFAPGIVIYLMILYFFRYFNVRLLSWGLRLWLIVP
jgi:autophagy-related protein 9